ncbi:hypothetical protein DFH09DRAFT_1312127 [Mycena vulgaris]|nr:hypothetical protein DFH09DRAFT_1312127 [Mycena vulgaris]
MVPLPLRIRAGIRATRTTVSSGLCASAAGDSYAVFVRSFTWSVHSTITCRTTLRNAGSSMLRVCRVRWWQRRTRKRGPLYSTFMMLWADQSAVHVVAPDFHLPACHVNVQVPPSQIKPVRSAVRLFFTFYASVRPETVYKIPLEWN